MFLVFNFKDLSNAVLTLVQLLILAMIFIVFPFWFLQTLIYLATSSGWYLVAGLVLLVAGFFFALMKKQMMLATLLGIASLAMAVCVLVIGHNMRTNAVEFGSPRNVLWVESLDAIYPYPVCRNECVTFRPILPPAIRAITDEANLDERVNYNFGQRARRAPGSIEITNYRITPEDLFDRYIEAAQDEGDWLAFHAECVLGDRQCGADTDTLAEAAREARNRYGIDVPARIAGHLGMADLTPETMETSAEFAAACHADAPCRSVMAGIGWPVIIGAASGQPVVVHTPRRRE